MNIIDDGTLVPLRTTAPTPRGHVDITTFGYLHGEAPPAHLTLDLRVHFRDPHVDPALRDLTGIDPEVRAAVLATPGIERLIDAIAVATVAFASGPGRGPILVAVGCAGGRHRSVVVGGALMRTLTHLWNLPHISASLAHRDIAQPVVTR